MRAAARVAAKAIPTAAIFSRRNDCSTSATREGSPRTHARKALRRATLKCRQPRRFLGNPFRREIRSSALTKAVTRWGHTLSRFPPAMPWTAWRPGSGGEQATGQVVARQA